MDKKFMLAAIKEAERGVKNGAGGPFGAVIVRKGKIVSSGHNRVPVSKDPTAHAEIEAIRKACKKLGTFDLSGCELYSTCEPCPMCLAAIMWARMGKVFFGATRKDAARIGFDDELFYGMIGGGKRGLKRTQVMREECLPTMLEWAGRSGKVRY